MNDDPRRDQVTRGNISKLLFDDEIARVSTGETADRVRGAPRHHDGTIDAEQAVPGAPSGAEERRRMGPTSDEERIEDDAWEKLDQRIEDAVERSISDFEVEETARKSLRPRADDELTKLSGM